jgi:hypothetical protein
MKRLVPLGLLFVLLVLFRALAAAFPNDLPNFQPLLAVFFCGALLATGWQAWAMPLAAWALTYPLGVGHTGSWSLFLTTLLALGATFVLGKFLAKRGAVTLLLGSVVAALSFHLITCGAAWLGDPRYAKSLAGFYQSVWAGAPSDVLPSWVFLRNLLAANLLFTGLVIVARNGLPVLRSSRTQPIISH